MIPRGPAWWLTLAGTTLLYFLSTPIVSGALLLLVESRPTPGLTPERLPEAIVVLSAGMRRAAPEYGGDTVDEFTLERIRYAARLQRDTRLSILVSGGLPKGASTSTAEAMRNSLVEDFGAKVKWIEGRAASTRGNAARSAEILKREGISSIFLVTHAVHLPRAKRAVEREGLSVTAAGPVFTPRIPDLGWDLIIPGSRNLTSSWYAVYELAGGIFYRLAYAP